MPSRWAQMGAQIGGGFGQGVSQAMGNKMQRENALAKLKSELEMFKNLSPEDRAIYQEMKNPFMSQMMGMVGGSPMGSGGGTFPRMPGLAGPNDAPPVDRGVGTIIANEGVGREAPFGVWVHSNGMKKVPGTQEDVDWLKEKGFTRQGG